MSSALCGARPTNTGAAFSLPVHQVEAYIKRLVGEGDAEAGYLGVDAETVMGKRDKAVGAKTLYNAALFRPRFGSLASLTP